MENTVSKEEVQMTVTASVLKMSWEEGFDPLMLNEMEGFQQSVKVRNDDDPNFYVKDVDELTSISEPEELFEFIIGDDYWVRYFTAYLLNKVIYYTYVE